LNVITINNNFPSPMMYKLIDEFYGVQCFSKLDLRLGYHHILVTLVEKTHFTVGYHRG